MAKNTSGSQTRVFNALLCCGGAPEGSVLLGKTQGLAEPASGKVHEAADQPKKQWADPDAKRANMVGGGDLDNRMAAAVAKRASFTAGSAPDVENVELQGEALERAKASEEATGPMTEWVNPNSTRMSFVGCADKLTERVAKSANGASARRASVAADSVTQLYDLYYKEKSGTHVRLRWNLLWGVFVMLGLYPFLGAVPSLCGSVYSTTFTVMLVQAVLLSVGAVSCWVYMSKMWWSTKISWDELAVERFGPEAVERVRHIFVLPAYKEPLELLENTIATVAEQTVAKKIVMVVTLEESSPTLDMAKDTLPKKFKDSFAKVIVTMHPKGLQDEIPGACSNRNWGVRRAVQIMNSELEADDDATLVTVCDSDTIFHPRYAECLTHKFLATPDACDKCYQSPLFYNISLDQRYFFTRATAVIRAFLMVGFLIPMSINTMSIYSILLPLLKKAKFFHPGYQMDDIIFTLSAMQAIGKRVFIKMIEVPTLSGPTSGDSFSEELEEWYVQAKRWTIGAGEVFHYFFIKLIRQRFTFISGMSYGMWLTVYYAFFLCAAGIVSLVHTFMRWTVGTFAASLTVETCLAGSFWANLGLPVGMVELILVVYTYLIFFGTAFIMDRRLVSVLRLPEQVSIATTALHFLSSQLVLWGYCVVECVAIVILSVHGKKVCGHKPSNKDSLVKK